eukprot:35925_1
MGNTQSQDKLQKSAKTMRTQSMVINAECNQIRLACNKNKSLEILQLKLAVFEEKTFKKIKYDSKCAHSDCNEKAPKDFPSTDAYICTTHARQVGLDCQEKLRSIHKKYWYFATETAGKMNDKHSHGTKSLESVMRIPDDFIASLLDGSINEIVEYPEDYWSLLMTKLVTRFRYELSLGHRQNLDKIILINSILKLLVLFRHFMNPNGEELLKVIRLAMTHMDSTGVALVALNDILATISASIVAMYAVAFFAGLALVLGVVNNPTNIGQLIGCVVAGTAFVAGGVVVCVLTLGAGVPFSAPLFGTGFGFFVKASQYDGGDGKGIDVDNPLYAVHGLAQRDVNVATQLNAPGMDDPNVLRQMLVDLER